MKWFVKEFPQMFALDFTISRGWGNGYVALPKGHPWYGVHYDEIPAYIHGGLTFSQSAPNWSEDHDFDPESWVIGFDTAHYGDNITLWPKERVEEEAIKLFNLALECQND